MATTKPMPDFIRQKIEERKAAKAAREAEETEEPEAEEAEEVEEPEEEDRRRGRGRRGRGCCFTPKERSFALSKERSSVGCAFVVPDSAPSPFVRSRPFVRRRGQVGDEEQGACARRARRRRAFLARLEEQKDRIAPAAIRVRRTRRFRGSRVSDMATEFKSSHDKSCNWW